MLALISFLGIIVVVVAVHEYGHYLAARSFGVLVLRFSVGLGKPIWRRRDRRGTEWVLAPFPLGGYVQMLDAETAERHNLPREMTMEARHPLERIVIYAAGPVANIVLAFVLSVALLAGGEQGLRPLVDRVAPDSPAARVGMVAGEEIVAVNGDEVRLWRQVRIAIADAVLGEEPVVFATRAGRTYTIPAEALSLDDVAAGRELDAIGMSPFMDYVSLRLAIVVPDGPAAAAGMRVGDEIVQLGDQVMEDWYQAADLIAANPNVAMSAVVWRETAAVAMTVRLDGVRRGGREVGYLGVAPVIDREALVRERVSVSYSAPQVVAAAASRTAGDVARAVGFLWLMVSGEASGTHVAGPVQIAATSGEAAALGFGAWLRFLTLISTSLGILNLLPLPLLDGGQIVLNVIELLRKRGLNARWQRLWNMTGVFLLLTLMLFVIINDIVRLF